jgi:anaphase-promoting complex subunit 2
VLLDRVARPIRRYLRDREDTIKIIVGGLLADVTETRGRDNSSDSDTLVELSTELAKAHEQSFRNDAAELDWDDMNWVPDPIDAALDYKKSKNSDVIGSLISLFESKETFVKELQIMLGERLLRKRTDLSQELSVLELLKVRFGDGALQACEVMLRDILDSKRVDTAIRGDQGLTRGLSSPQRIISPYDEGTVSEHPDGMPQLHAKILSRFFWPTLLDHSFKIPDEIVSLQQRYSAGFESLKQSRKLTWLNELGQVTVELDLEDRVFTDEVTTWQASVIYAFQSPSQEGSKQATGPVMKGVTELAQQLEMPTPLVRNACLFWVSKKILTEPQPDTFRVLEVLPNNDEGSNGDDNANTDATGAPRNEVNATVAAAKDLADAAAMEKMNLYWQFIVGMLTNQGAMPLPRIVMMLKIAVPGGFPYSNEELREFLTSMVSREKLEIVSGGSYKLISGHP